MAAQGLIDAREAEIALNGGVELIEEIRAQTIEPDRERTDLVLVGDDVGHPAGRRGRAGSLHPIRRVEPVPALPGAEMLRLQPERPHAESTGLVPR